MQPCRDCGAATAPSAHSCPACGIWNPVLQWVAFPDGSHREGRAPARGSFPPGFASAAGSLAPSFASGTLAPAFATAGGGAATMYAPAPRVPRSTHWLGRHFSGIHTRAEADDAIAETSKGFLAIAAFQAVLGFLFAPPMLVDAALNAGLALWLRSRASQIAAVLLLLLSGFSLVNTVMARLGMADGGRNVILALIAVTMGFRAVMATRALTQLRTA